MFAFTSPVGSGRAKLHVSYQGEISRKDMRGIFQVKDVVEWYIYSQFDEIGARQAVPCFDEPGCKVPWQLTLHVKKDQAALSNTAIVSEIDSSDGFDHPRQTRGANPGHQRLWSSIAAHELAHNRTDGVLS